MAKTNEQWIEADFDQLRAFSAQEWARWLQDGLTMWYQPTECWKAFDPIRDRFTLADRIEGQINDMYEKMPDLMARRFLEGVFILLSEEGSDEVWQQSMEEIAGILVFRIKQHREPDVPSRPPPRNKRKLFPRLRRQ